MGGRRDHLRPHDVGAVPGGARDEADSGGNLLSDPGARPVGSRRTNPGIGDAAADDAHDADGFDGASQGEPMGAQGHYPRGESRAEHLSSAADGNHGD